MKTLKMLGLLIALNGACFTAYSQGTEQLPLKEINYRLAEGLECKELIAVKNDRIDTLELLVGSLRSQVTNLTAQVQLWQENYQGAVSKNVALQDALDTANGDKEKAEKEAGRLKKGRNTWRVFSVIEAGVITVLLLLK